MERDFPTDTSLKDLLEVKLSDKPLNDVGKKRIVRFNALGSTWQISFNNDYETTPIAEEFCGIIQVMLSEIALSKYDFHLLKSSIIKLELEINPGYLAPEQLPSHEEFEWKVFLEFFDSADSKEINMHTARSSVAVMYILDEISLLPKEEFKELFNKLFTESDLAGKTLVLGSYQRMYRYVFKQKRFDRLQRQHFEPVDVFFLNLPNVNPVMEWKNDISQKYNQQEALRNIQQRFKNSHQCIYLTIEKLKQNKKFSAFVNELRIKGWVDWQILIAMMNFMVSYKTRIEISNQSFETEENYREAFDELFHKLRHTDEKDCYIEFPLEAFDSEGFKFQVNHTFVIILHSFGLENKLRFPNFSAVKEFLDIRFNMKNDKVNDNNPLYEIK